jgi:hypothetical protein
MARTRLSKVRQYLKAGNFSGSDHACHDGANWIKLSQVPGITPEACNCDQTSPQAKPKKKKKIRKVRLVVVSLCVFLFLSLIALSIVGLINSNAR